MPYEVEGELWTPRSVTHLCAHCGRRVYLSVTNEWRTSGHSFGGGCPKAKRGWHEPLDLKEPRLVESWLDA